MALITKTHLTNHNYISEFTSGKSKVKTVNISRSFLRDPLLPTHEREPLHIGDVGDRAYLFLKFVHKKNTKSGYSVFKFVDEGNNNFICFSSADGLKAPEGYDLIQGECYVVIATIKRHSINDYNAPTGSSGGIRENVINRAVVLATIGKKE